MIHIKWKIINNNSYEKVKGDLLNTLLGNRGVENIIGLLNVNEDNIHHWSLLHNAQNGIECLKKHISNNSKIHIRIDPDCDGNTSAAYIYQYLLKNFKVKCTYNTSEKKTHGIILKELKDYDFDLLIVPDGGSFDYKEQRQLIKEGRDILILDHHSPEEDAEIEKTGAIVINPQLDSYPNKTLAGVGVVHKFCEALDETFGLNDSKNYIDLVSLGCVADNMDLRELETRWYVLQGIKQMREDVERKNTGEKVIGNLFIQEIIYSKKDNKLKHVNIDSIGWNISPLINGTVRSGTMEEKLDMFRAMIGEEEERWYQPRRKCKDDPKPEPVKKTLQEEMVRICTNAKSRQDRLKAKNVEKIEQRIIDKNLNQNKILIVDGTEDIEDSTLSGLVANGLAAKYKKPVVILRKRKEGLYGGSARNCNLSPIENLNGFLSQTGHFEFVAGHNNAFGFSIKEGELLKINATLKEMLKDIVMEDTYLVDYQIPVGRLNGDEIIKVGNLRDFWGNTLHKPIFAITDITMEAKDIELIGERKNVLKFKKGDITFIRFFANEDMLDKMKMKNKNGFSKSPSTVKLDIIGEFHADEYEGRLYPSIHIIDFNVSKKETPLF